MEKVVLEARPKVERKSEGWLPRAIGCLCAGKLVHEIRNWVLGVAAFRSPEKIVVAGCWDAMREAERVEREIGIGIEKMPLIVGDWKRVARVESVVCHSEYWNKELIWWKTRCAEMMVEKFGSLLFVDSDWMPCDNWEKKLFGDVILSPFYWGEGFKRELVESHGIYNAGMIGIRS